MKLPFNIAISSRLESGVVAAEIGANHMISLLDPGVHVLRPPSVPADRHLWITCRDVSRADERGAPRRSQVADILSFSTGILKNDTVLVHCEAGISRSTAAALLLLVNACGVDHIDEALKQVLAMRPLAMPNRLIAFHGDKLIGAGGRLVEAVDLFNASID